MTYNLLDPFVRQLSGTGCAIYLFHGVVDRYAYAVRNYTRKHVSRAQFVAFLRALRAYGGVPLRMDDVIAHSRAQQPFPPGAYAITFDDGFANNVEIAAPILADFDIPATFYLTTHWVDANAMVWVDRAEHILECAAPSAVMLPWEESPRFFGDCQSRIAVLEALRVELKGSSRYDPDAIVAMLAEQCGVPEPQSSADALDRKLTWDQVRALTSDGRFTIGGHSHTHPILAFLDRMALDGEIATSIQRLHERAGITTVHYAYPVGLVYCYSDEVITALRAHGIACCPTAMSGVNTHETDLFHLKRIPVMWDARMEDSL